MELLTETKTPLLTSASEGGKRKKVDQSNAAKVDYLLSPDGNTLLFSGTSEESPPVFVSCALRWSSDMYTESILSFCNSIRTKDGGSHVDGLKNCLTRTVNQFAKKAGKIKEGNGNLPGEFVREGLTAIVAVNVQEPEFEGQTKGRLGNPEVRPAMEQILSSQLTMLFEWRPDIMNKIVEKATAAQQAAVAARAARCVANRLFLGELVDACSFRCRYHFFS